MKRKSPSFEVVMGVFLVLLAMWIFPHPATAAEPEITNLMCPVLTDEAIDPNIHVEYEGKTVYFCCMRCQKKFMESPERYLVYLPQFAAGLKTGDTSSHDHEIATSTAPMSDAEGAMDHHSEKATSPPHRHEDHAHASEEMASNDVRRLIVFAGKFHPVVVHFPIALLIMALLGEIAASFKPSDLFRHGARFCVWAGGLGAIVAALLGWAAASSGRFPGMETTLLWHRWIGTAIAVTSVLLIGSKEMAVKNPRSSWRTGYLILLTAATLAIGVTAHLGAVLIYGWDHFNF